MSEDPDIYLIWSHEHQAWWGAGAVGYTERLSLAGRYSRRRAVEIATSAIPGNADRHHCLTELPVRLADVEEMRDSDYATYPDLPPEPWQ